MNQDRIAQAMVRLHRIMAVLRAPGGCPWDAAQTPQTLRPFLIEEAYEVLEAIDGNSPGEIRDELGDLLLQVVFQAQIFTERGEFDLADVAHAICDKLERRHPHVFGEAEYRNDAELDRQWNRIKAAEKLSRGRAGGAFEDIPPALPALMRAGKIFERSARQGLSHPPPAQTAETLMQSLRRLSPGNSSPDPEQARIDLGEFLLHGAQLAHGLGVDAEDALRLALARFADRFRRMEKFLAATGRVPTDCSGEELASIWSNLVAQEGENFPSRPKT